MENKNDVYDTDVVNIKKETCINSLKNQIQHKLTSELGPTFKELFSDANNLFKEQMREAYLGSHTKCELFKDLFNKQFEKWYNETYGKY